MAYDPEARHREYLKYSEKTAEQRKHWYREHKEEQNARTRNWAAKNKERQRELTSRWYQENRELHLERSRQWAAANRQRKAAYRRARRAKERGAPGQATSTQVEWRVAYHRYRCVYCGGPYEEIDHAIPISRGGSNWPANLVPSCRSCNRHKHTKTWKEFVGDQHD